MPKAFHAWFPVSVKSQTPTWSIALERKPVLPSVSHTFLRDVRTNIEYLSARENRGRLFSRAFTFFDYSVIPEVK